VTGRPIRSWLYVPGHRADRFDKAVAEGADAVVIDLEDSVPFDRKKEARANTISAVLRWRDEPVPPEIWVRSNPLRTPQGQEDVEALRDVPIHGLRIPRAEDPRAIAQVGTQLAVPLHLVVETAKGLLMADELATAHPRVVRLGLGEADLSADLRVHSSTGLDWARGWIVVASRAAGLASPIQSVWTALEDTRGLRASTEAGFASGFFGRSVIHPRQIPIVHQAYEPDAAAVASARAVLRAFRAAEATGEVAAVTPDGQFVDPAVVSQAQLVIGLAALTGSPEPTPT
jgi:citrate lyase subunit beta/citryl-CoA lyase